MQTGRLSEQSNLRLLQTVNVLKTNIHSNETKVIDDFPFLREKLMMMLLSPTDQEMDVIFPEISNGPSAVETILGPL